MDQINLSFEKALKAVYRRYRSSKKLSAPFFVYCLIMDYIGNSYEDKKRADAFFAVSKKIDLWQLAKSGISYLVASDENYAAVADVVNKRQFNWLVKRVFFAVQGKKNAMATAADNVASGSEQQNTTSTSRLNNNDNDGNVSRSVCKEDSESDAVVATNSAEGVVDNTLQQTTQDSGFEHDWDIFLGKLIIGALGVVVLIVLGVFGIPWFVYQWILGLGASLVCGFVTEALLANYETILFAHVFEISMFVVSLVLRFVLLDSFKVVCAFIAIAGLLSSYWVSCADVCEGEKLAWIEMLLFVVLIFVNTLV